MSGKEASFTDKIVLLVKKNHTFQIFSEALFGKVTTKY